MNMKEIKGKVHYYINYSQYDRNDKGLWLIKGVDIVSGTFFDVVAYAITKKLVSYTDHNSITKIEPKPIQKNYFEKVMSGEFEREKKNLEIQLEKLKKEQEEIQEKLKKY